MRELRDRGRSGIVFGVVPDVDDAATRANLLELCAALSQRYGERIVPRIVRTPLELAKSFATGDVQLAWVSPTLLLTARELEQAEPLVRAVRQGATAFHGVVFVVDSSPIKSVLDLKGKRAAWVAPTSASGYIFPRLVLASRGIDPTTFFESETFYHSHGNVARAVLDGRADVGGVYGVFEGGDATRDLLRAPFLERLPGEPAARILFATDAIPSDVFIASRTLSRASLDALCAAFESVHEDASARGPIAQVFGADSFARHDPESLATLREQVAYGRELGLMP